MQATGGWNKEEHDRFMKLIENGVDYKWGLLSMNMPGRVGYQCSNYYRKLVQEGALKDPNYIVDAEGKLKFLRGSDKEAIASGGSAAAPRSKSKKVKNPKKTPKKPKVCCIFFLMI